MRIVRGYLITRNGIGEDSDSLGCESPDSGLVLGFNGKMNYPSCDRVTATLLANDCKRQWCAAATVSQLPSRCEVDQWLCFSYWRLPMLVANGIAFVVSPFFRATSWV
ncbi:hypothetical protein AG1IA_10342 [Rhizoctonia solani AG-1 IA]|uniref:Uncharacterized protein n=1 Tax=Thanatephorus cucumeris (strain AG1-IA) TaxID=983506 RepID=L8WFR3_THACA|nr:hypothetical protein AG1IA_10342 [Rhizoctonia solani AG-1 IA]